MTAACAIGDFQPRLVNAALAWSCKVVASSLLIAPTWAPFSTADADLAGATRRSVDKDACAGRWTSSWSAVPEIVKAPRWWARWQLEHYAASLIMPRSRMALVEDAVTYAA